MNRQLSATTVLREFVNSLMRCGAGGLVIAALAAVASGVGGCGNVYLRGDALTAAKTSAMDAYQAANRAGATTTTGSASLTTSRPALSAAEGPTWEQSYLIENYKQWRQFVRSASKDWTWGPKLVWE